MSIVRNSHEIAHKDAVKIWSVCGAQYINNTDVLHPIEIHLQEQISSFALNARRVLESFDKNTKFSLNAACWSRSGNVPEDLIEKDLWNALNLIIHASSFEVIFENLPDHLSYIQEENRVVAFIKVSTDKRSNVYVDPFSMAYSYLAEAQYKFLKNP